MNYLEKFEKYWNEKGNYLDIPNKKRIYNKFMALYSNVKKDYEIYDIIDDYIIKRKSYHMKEVQLDFYNWLKNGIEPDSKLHNTNLEMTKIERQINILKNSHGEFKITDLAESYNESRDTIADDIKAIEDGIYLFETEIKPNIKHDGPRRIYKDTVHPIFLALNLTEVNTFMKFLPEFLEKCKDKAENEAEKSQLKLILGLITRMQIQLSDYAIDKLGINIDHSNKELRFVSEESLIKEFDELVKLMKASNKPRKLIVNSVNEYEGVIKPPSDNEYMCIIKTIDGKEIKVSKDDNLSLLDDYKKIGNGLQ